MLHRNERVSRTAQPVHSAIPSRLTRPAGTRPWKKAAPHSIPIPRPPPTTPAPFTATTVGGLKPEDRQPLPQHQTPRYRRGHHERGPRPHKNPVREKIPFVHSRGLRSLPRHALSMGGFERTVEPWQVRTVDGDTIRYGTDRIRIRGYNAPELSEPGGREAALRLEQLMQEGADQHRPAWPRCLRPHPGRCLRKRPERGGGDDGGGFGRRG
jgi:micrococcal nuclease